MNGLNRIMNYLNIESEMHTNVESFVDIQFRYTYILFNVQYFSFFIYFIHPLYNDINKTQNKFNQLLHDFYFSKFSFVIKNIYYY